MKNKESQSQKLLHNFVCVTVIIICLILLVMGVFATKNNTEALDSGVMPAMIYAAKEDTEISVKIDKSVYTSKEIDKFPFDTVLSLAPAPIGNIYLICKNAKNLAEEKIPPDFFDFISNNV